MKAPKRMSLWRKIISIFVVTSTIPIILLCLFMLYNTTEVLKKNTETLTQNSLKQLNDNLEIQLEAYEDMLYQIYTGDEVVEWVDKLNAREDVPVTINQLRRYLRGILNSKDYIRSITLITESGMEVTCDCITAKTYTNSWIENFSLSKEELYEEVAADNRVHIYPTEYGTTFASEDYYLFHIGHRVIDYKNLNKDMGIIIISLDEELLQHILQPSYESNSANLLLDRTGRVISCQDKEKIGSRLFEAGSAPEEKWDSYTSFVSELLQIDQDYISVSAYQNDDLKWEIVSAMDQSIILKEIYNKVQLIAFVCIVLLAVTLFTVWKLSRQLIESVNTVVTSMQAAGAGDLTARVPVSATMPLEIEMVAAQFNETLEKLIDAQEKEKAATDKQRKAEIKVLEAQINPHFLYNTLDTINWMAIDRDEFDISNAIGSLANILRYAITDSNGTVCVKDEIQWLKKYIYLQQFRLKNKFVRHIEASPEVLDIKIHKLLLQPFVENAILHGFSSEQEEYILEVFVFLENDRLQIIIRDNGCGMDAALVEKINSGQQIEKEEKSHIGMNNAIMRLNMYCDGRARVSVKSEAGKGTEILLSLPVSPVG